MDEEGLLQNSNFQNGDGSEAATSDTSKFTVVVVFSSLVALSGFFAFGCANGYSSPAESGIIHDLSLSTAEYSFFGSLVFFGSMLGAIISGKVADFIGRKGALWLNSLLHMIGWLAIVFAEGIWSLDFGRLLVGFSCGVQCYVSVVYVAEIIPKSIRGGFTMANQLIVSGAIAVMFSVGNIISWRNLALIGTVACIIQFIGSLFIPESPRWLSKVGRYKDAESILQWLRGEGTDISKEATEIQDSSQSLKEKLVPTFKEFLISKRYARLLTVGVGLPFLLPWVGANGVLLYASSIFKAAGCGAGLATTTMAFIQIPFAVLGALFMDKFGRRPLLIVQLAGVCLGSILIALGFLLQDMQLWTNIAPRIVLFGILIYFSLYSFGAGLPFVIISEIFPMNLKSTAGSFAVFVLSLNSWIVSYAFNFMFEWNSAGTFFIFSIICVLLIAIVVKMLPETKGRSLEEIEASWLQEDVY